MANVIIYSQDVIGKAMASPAIRFWQFASVLSKWHNVTLVTPNLPEISHPSFKIMFKNDPAFVDILKQADVIIVHRVSAKLAYLCKKHHVKILFDAYCPVILEALELFKEIPPQKKKHIIERTTNDLIFGFKMADAVICASEKQRDLWLGLIMSLGHLINYHAKDSSLRDFIDVVPFGLPSFPLPEKNGPGPKELFHLKETDKIVLWGGSICDWFDPCTLIRAMKLVAAKRDDVKLVFMGVKHPNDGIPDMPASLQAIHLAKELGLYNTSVFFNYKWLPYDQRHNFLQEADIGISIHSKHLETNFSFRTRMLDYLWAGLPIINTEGDTFADLIQRNRLGIVVPYHDEKRVYDAIINILDNEALAQEFKSNCLQISQEFQWETLVIPLHKMIERLSGQKKPSFTLKEHITIAKASFANLNSIVRIFGLGYVFKRLAKNITKFIPSKETKTCAKS
jgi:glycosyltransferase involved in cell wall biosynthesis